MTFSTVLRTCSLCSTFVANVLRNKYIKDSYTVLKYQVVEVIGDKAASPPHTNRSVIRAKYMATMCTPLYTWFRRLTRFCPLPQKITRLTFGLAGLT